MMFKKTAFLGLLLSVAFVPPAAGLAATFAIHGDIVSDEGAQRGWIVFDESKILAVQFDKDGEASAPDLPPDARRIDREVYIYPGLIDCHNHAEWNVIPAWRAGRTFANRYQWQDDPDYLARVSAPYYQRIQDNGLGAWALEYSEIRAILGGTTTLQSSYPRRPPPMLVRNLDSDDKVDSRVADITQASPGDLLRFRAELESEKTRRLFLHLGEGRRDDARSMGEFAFLKRAGLARPGVVIIHGVALDKQDFQLMAAQSMPLVWSPTSNFVLYGETTRIEDALAAGVTVALAPDWTITGSDNVLEEMKTAHQYLRDKIGDENSARLLFRMVASNAARVAGLEGKLGVLQPGCGADLFLAPKLHSDPFVNLLNVYPRDIRLVFIAGRPVYGDLDLLGALVSGGELDDLEFSDPRRDQEPARKVIRLASDADGEMNVGLRFHFLQALLRYALDQPRQSVARSGLAPLAEDDVPNRRENGRD